MDLEKRKIINEVVCVEGSLQAQCSKELSI